MTRQIKKNSHDEERGGKQDHHDSRHKPNTKPNQAKEVVYEV